MPKISVIMPAYNHERFVGLAIQSVLDQTFQDFELIIVDDCSNDRTADEIRKFSDHRIKLILHEKNMGSSAAMRTCLEHATGEYIAVINSDDIFLPSKLEIQLSFLESHHQYKAVFSFIDLIDENGNSNKDQTHAYYSIFEQKNRNRFEWLNYFFYEGNCLCHPTILIRKECYDEIGYYNESLAQLPDFDFWIRFCLKYELFVLPEKLLKFRILPNEQNASGQSRESNIRTFNELYWVLENYLKISRIEELLKIFPNLSLNKQQSQAVFIPFLIARLALSSSQRGVQKFGIDTLYNLLKNSSMCDNILTAFNFTIKDFIRISGKIDSLNRFFDEYTHLYIDSGSGFNENEKVTVEADFNKQNFDFTFDVSQYPVIKFLRWDPVEFRLCNISIKYIAIKDKNSIIHPVDPNLLQSNAENKNLEMFYFDTLDPHIIFQIPQKVLSVQIQGNWKIFNAWHTSQRLSALKDELHKTNETKILLNNEIVAKDQQLQHLNGEVSTKDCQLQHLNGEVSAKDCQLHLLNEEVSAKDRQLHLLNEEVSAKDRQLHLLNELLIQKEQQRLDLERSLISIHNSFSWQLVKKYDKYITKILPLRTKRRKYYESVLTNFRKNVNINGANPPKKIETLAESNDNCHRKKNKEIIFENVRKLHILMQKSIRFIKENGIIKFIHIIRYEFRIKNQEYKLKDNRSLSQIVTQSPQPRTVRDILNERFAISRPLRIFQAPVTRRRLNLVTDSINGGSLFGGVATAIIFSALLSERWKCDLRVITRTEKPNEVNFGKILKLNTISLTKNVEFLFADINSKANEVDVSRGDIFLTTSWWTTKSVLQSVNASQIFYLLQEDERMFYPYSDDHLKCTEVLRNAHLKFVINSKLLFDHFVSEGFENICKNGTWFEPSFNPETFYYDKSQTPKKTKRNFFFYARPNHPRNLFYLGLEVIAKAVERNIINVNEWDIYFAGKDIPPIGICADYSPIIVPNMDWDEYCNFARRMDLGFCLMYTPHPSYPPLDLAASGAIVVTNTFGNKSNLDCYSRNIICKDTTVESLLEGLAQGISLAEKSELRLQNYKDNNLSRNWERSFHDVISALENGMSHV